jgi:hemin uptake protein HemP
MTGTGSGKGNKQAEENAMQHAERESAPGVRLSDAVEKIRTVPARDLLGPRGILRIDHQGETYTLRLTRNNRLILTK